MSQIYTVFTLFAQINSKFHIIATFRKDMSNGFYTVPEPLNEPVKDYAPGSAERAELQAMLKKLRSEVYDIPMFIGGEEVKTDNKVAIHPPHDHKHLLG